MITEWVLSHISEENPGGRPVKLLKEGLSDKTLDRRFEDFDDAVKAEIGGGKERLLSRHFFTSPT